MLRLVEYGLLAVSLLMVIGLIMASPRGPAQKPAENSEAEKGQVGKEQSPLQTHTMPRSDRPSNR